MLHYTVNQLADSMGNRGMARCREMSVLPAGYHLWAGSFSWQDPVHSWGIDKLLFLDTS